MTSLRTSADFDQPTSMNALPAPLPASVELLGPLTLTACSLCLRVLHHGEWIEPETAIVELRSFEHQAAPLLEPALCAHCAEAIDQRRVGVTEPLAA
jgi:hypothetical protein